MSIPDFCCRFL